MKFAKYQANNLIPEWRIKYLDVFHVSPYADRKQYKKGKKLLKEVRKARWRPRLLSTLVVRSPNGNEVNGEDRRTSSRSSRYSRNNEPEISPRQVSPQSRLPSSTVKSNGSGGFPIMDKAQQTSGSVRPCTPVVLREHRGHKSMTVNFSQSQTTLPQGFDTRGWISTLDIELSSLTEDHNIFDETELNFLQWLDMEIQKIDDFYREKENVAVTRYKLISAQIEALCQLRDSHLINESNISFQSSSTPSWHHDSSGSRSTWQKLISKLRASFDRLSSAMPTADHERRVKHPELVAKPITTTAGYVDYRVARRRLKQAILEFYRGMELLKEYRLLNRIGLAKILKKFDKIAGREISGNYSEKLRSMHFDQSDELKNLLERTEV